MEVGARRWTLRHESRYYGTQQARKLFNALTSERGTWSVLALQELLLYENSRENKDRAIRVPAATVIPEVRVMFTIIGSKAPVAGLVSSL